MANNKNKVIKQKPRFYTSRDFDGFRSDLQVYAQNYFADQIKDFSDASVGGLLLDVAAFIGDNLSYYQDYQFNELDPLNCVEPGNLERHARLAGVEIRGASPAVVELEVFIIVPSEIIPGTSGDYRPKEITLPIIRQHGTAVNSISGITFTFENDVDFSEKNQLGHLTATVTVLDKDSSGKPKTYILSKKVLATSGVEVRESHTMPPQLVPFTTISLRNTDVSRIISVKDSANNEYFEVQNLTQDTVYRSSLNLSNDKYDVPRTLEIIPAPRRYQRLTGIQARRTLLQFGAGSADTFDDDIIPDPSELSLNLYGKKEYSRFSIDPNRLLNTQTLGIAPSNTTVTVIYRHGGGANHNVLENTIRTFSSTNLTFKQGLSTEESRAVRLSLDVSNPQPAAGGAPAPTLEQIRTAIPFARTQQNRIVTREDLLARIVSMPNDYGKVYRAGLRSTPTNPLSMSIYIVGQDISGQLSHCTDTLKINMRTMINDQRLVSDAFDILDSPIINFGINFNIISSPTSNKFDVVENCINRLAELCRLEFMGIDKPLLESEFIQSILSTPDVISLVDFSLVNKTVSTESREYSDYVYDLERNKNLGMYFPPAGGIFEMRHPGFDIVGGVQ